MNSIHACNEHETTFSTVEAWTLLDLARRFYVQKAHALRELGLDFSAEHGCLLDCTLKMRHIERILNNGVPITTETGL